MSSSQHVQSTRIAGMHMKQSPHSLVDALTISSRDIADWSHIPRNIPWLSYNSSGTPNSPTRPLSMTRIRSQDMMVRRRCAMHSKVLPVNSRCIVLWIWASVSRSASSAGKPNVLLTNSGGRFIYASIWSTITRYSPRRTILDYNGQLCL